MTKRLDGHSARTAAQFIYSQQVEALANTDSPGSCDWDLSKRADAVFALVGLPQAVFRVAASEAALKMRQRRHNEQAKYFAPCTTVIASRIEIISTPVADVVDNMLGISFSDDVKSLWEYIDSETQRDAIARLLPDLITWKDILARREEKRRSEEEYGASLGAAKRNTRKSRA